jgi:osmotically-inducible protein OsmY
MTKRDSKLQHDVMEELAWDPRIDHAGIGVAAKGGVVSLSGFVTGFAEKLAAERAAMRVAGVKAVANEIKVRFASDHKLADHEIAKRIRDIFAYNVLIPEEAIQITVDGGWVKLSGIVEWRYQSEEAARAASKISGVTGVSNGIVLRSKMSIADIRRRIEDAFKRQAGLDAAAVQIAMSGTKVTLSGHVKALHERRLAEQAAWLAPGVTQVEDKITVG